MIGAAPAVRLLSFDPAAPSDLVAATIGFARVRLADAVVFELELKRLPSGDARVLWPAAVRPYELAIGRAIEAETLRQLHERGDLARGSELDDDEDLDASARARRNARRFGARSR